MVKRDIGAEVCAAMKKGQQIDFITQYTGRLSPIQRRIQKSKCPACKEGRLHKVVGETEIMLWCNSCLFAMDSDGGCTA